jgi:hypothetical protein
MRTTLTGLRKQANDWDTVSHALVSTGLGGTIGGLFGGGIGYAGWGKDGILPGTGIGFGLGGLAGLRASLRHQYNQQNAALSQRGTTTDEATIMAEQERMRTQLERKKIEMNRIKAQVKENYARAKYAAEKKKLENVVPGVKFESNVK